MNFPKHVGGQAHEVTIYGLNCSVWSDKDGLLPDKWRLGQTQLTVPSQRTTRSGSNYARPERAVSTTPASTPVPARSLASSASTICTAPPLTPSARAASPEEGSRVGSASSNASDEWRFCLMGRPLPCAPLAPEEIEALMPRDETLLNLVERHILQCRRLCLQYGHELVHGLMEEPDVETPRPAPAIAAPSLFDPLDFPHRFSPAEQRRPTKRAKSEPAEENDNLALMESGRLLYSSASQAPCTGIFYDIPASFRSPGFASESAEHRKNGSNGYATLVGDIIWQSKPAVTPHVSISSSKGPVGVDSTGWPMQFPRSLPCTNELFASMSDGLSSPQLSSFKFAGLQRTASGKYENANVASMNTAGLPYRPPTAIRYPANSEAAALYGQLGSGKGERYSGY